MQNKIICFYTDVWCLCKTNLALLASVKNNVFVFFYLRRLLLKIPVSVLNTKYFFV